MVAYLDHAAATPMAPEVLEAMEPFFGERYGNAGSFHGKGKEAKDALDAARATVAAFVGARPDELLFTGNGTESDNLAILGYARAHKAHGTHLVTTAIEHPAVLEAVEYLCKYEGFTSTVVPVGALGVVQAADVLAAVRPDTVLVSVMLANNEIGTIQPVGEIGAGIVRLRQEGKAPHVAFHTDACQAPTTLPVDVDRLHVDLLTLNASKLYGPKGIGALFVRRGVKLRPLMFGGSQERALRPGTEAVALAVGFARACELAQARASQEAERLRALRDALIDGLLARVPRTRLNGSREERLAGNVNLSFMDIEGEALVLYLDAAGIFVSTGSACTSASLDPSHVILALGVPFEVAHGSIRFSLGRSTTPEQIAYVLDTLPPLVEKLRAISPVHVDDKYWKSV
jgi:cysteine desulfurase